MNFYQYSIMALLVAMTAGISLAMELPEEELNVAAIIANIQDDSLVTGRSRARRQAAQQKALQREEALLAEQQAQANEALPTEGIQEQASLIASILSNESTFTQSQPFVDQRSSRERGNAARRRIAADRREEAALQLQASRYNQENKKPKNKKLKTKKQAEPTDADFKKTYEKVKQLR